MATDLRRKGELPDLTAQILETYKTNGKINHLGHCPLPNLATVIDIVEDLKEVIFPGYRRRQNLHLGNVAYRAGKKLEWDAGNLRCPNAPEADQFLRREYRPGWSLS